jgi:hypothetical protein
MPAVAQFLSGRCRECRPVFRLMKPSAPGERYLAYDTAARWLVCPEAEACRRIYRRSYRGENFPGKTGEDRRAQPISFCTRLQTDVRRSTPSLPHGASDGASHKSAAPVDASRDSDSAPGRLPRDQFIYQGLSQVRRGHAKRLPARPSDGAGVCLPAPLDLHGHHFKTASMQSISAELPNGFSRKPAAPIFRARSRTFGSGNAVIKMNGV